MGEANQRMPGGESAGCQGEENELWATLVGLRRALMTVTIIEEWDARRRGSGDNVFVEAWVFAEDGTLQSLLFY